MNSATIAAKLLTAVAFGLAGYTVNRADPWPFWTAVLAGSVALITL